MYSILLRSLLLPTVTFLFLLKVWLIGSNCSGDAQVVSAQEASELRGGVPCGCPQYVDRCEATAFVKGFGIEWCPIGAHFTPVECDPEATPYVQAIAGINCVTICEDQCGGKRMFFWVDCEGNPHY